MSKSILVTCWLEEIIRNFLVIFKLLDLIAIWLIWLESTSSLKIFALPDKYGPTGNYNFLREHHGLTGEQIAKKILKFLK